MDFTIQRDDPTAMLSVEQKQKALIESRRESVSSVGVTGWPARETTGQCVGYASHRDTIRAHRERGTDDGYCTSISNVRDEHGA